MVCNFQNAERDNAPFDSPDRFQQKLPTHTHTHTHTTHHFPSLIGFFVISMERRKRAFHSLIYPSFSLIKTPVGWKYLFSVRSVSTLLLFFFFFYYSIEDYFSSVNNRFCKLTWFAFVQDNEFIKNIRI